MSRKIEKIYTEIIEEHFCVGESEMYADIDIDSGNYNQIFVAQRASKYDEWNGLIVDENKYSKLRTSYLSKPEVKIDRTVISNAVRETWEDVNYQFYAECKTHNPDDWVAWVYNKETNELNFIWFTADVLKNIQKIVYPPLDERDDWEFDFNLYQMDL